MKKIPDNITCLHPDEVEQITELFQCEVCSCIFGTMETRRFPSWCPSCGSEFVWKDKETEMPKFKGIICRGSVLLGNGCDSCEKCRWEHIHRLNRLS